MTSSHSDDDVLNFLCDRRFHRQFTIPPDPSTGREKPYRVSYADYGDPASKATVLFFGGLMGGRFCYSPLDQLAKKHGVRIIHPERPGVGGSDGVAIEDRISTYIEMVPKLLEHLEIQHVSLAAHSFGTIYLLNTLLLYPHLLRPEKPYVAFFAPWVHPEHTGIKHLQAAELLPAGMIGKFSSLARFVNGTITPLTGMSAGLSSAIANGIKTSFPHGDIGAEPVPLEPNADGERATEGTSQAHGILDLGDAGVVKELRGLIPRFLFAEQVDGVGQDAQLCLRKPRSVPWCGKAIVWDDVDDAVRLFDTMIDEDEGLRGHARVRVDTFHAETDGMVGEKGRVWFDECWMREGAGQRTRFEYTSQVVQGADHDFILDSAFGASETWLKRVDEAFGGGAGDEFVGSEH